MKRSALSIVLAATLVVAGTDPEGVSLSDLADELEQAIQDKDASRISNVAERVEGAVSADEQGEAADQLAVQLSKAAKVAKRDLDALEFVLEALGHLRSRKGAPTLKRFAFRKDAKDERAADLQALALVALGRMADSRQLRGIEDQTKNRNMTVAKGAYTSLVGYASANGKTRKRVAEILMKGLLNEYPRYSPSNGKYVSDEKRKRWSKLSGSIVRSLQAVCRQPTITSVDDWEQWWRENKRKTKSWRDERD